MKHLLRRYALLTAIFVSMSVFPYGALAQELTNSGDVRAVTEFAKAKGWCRISKDERTADCAKETTICDAKQWAAFIADNVTFVGGGTPQQKTAQDRTSQSTSIGSRSSFGFGMNGSSLSAPGPGELLPDSVYTFLRKNPNNREFIPPLNIAACYCECPNGSSNASCDGKQEGTPYRIGTDLFTREECVSLCAKSENSGIASKCAGSLPSFENTDTSSIQGQHAAQASLSASDNFLFCFSQADCSTQKGTWEAWDQCQSGKGRCVAPEPSLELNTPIGSLKTVQGFGNYVIAIFRYMLSIVVFVTTVMFIWGAFRYLVGSSRGNVGRGRQIMKDAIIGMILLLCSVAILRTINPATLTMSRVKIYMTNTAQFIQAQYCKDLSGGERLADAGDSLAPRDRMEVEKNLTAYDTAPTHAECGHGYYIKSSIAGTCEGTVCAHPNEVCVSCASGIPLACLNQQSMKKVCDPQIFAGSINYGNYRYAERVSLVGVCGYAQVDPYDSEALSKISNNMTIVASVDLAKVAQQSGATGAGQQMYSFKVSDSDIQKAISACPNGFRGFLLAVFYYDGQLTAADTALLSKQNCVGGKGLFDGYGTGSISDQTDIAKSFLCGLRKTPARFLDSSGTYWKKEELQAAVGGRQAISCNFDLSDANAPSSPGEKDPFCPIAAQQQQAVQSAPDCAVGIKNGDSCTNTVHTCKLNTSLCTCDIDTSSIGFGGTAGQVTPRKWVCR